MTSPCLSTRLPSWEQCYLHRLLPPDKTSSAQEVDAIKSISDRKSLYSVFKKKAEPSGQIPVIPLKKTIKNFSVQFPNKVTLPSFASGSYSMCPFLFFFSSQEKQSISEQTIVCLNKDRNSRQSGESPLGKYCSCAIKHLISVWNSRT